MCESDCRNVPSKEVSWVQAPIDTCNYSITIITTDLR